MPLAKPYTLPNVTLTASPPAASPRAFVGGIPSNFGAALVVFDLLSFYLSFIVASLVTADTQYFTFDAAPSVIDVLITRQYIHVVLCTVGLVMFWSKGLYTRRMPWWSQMQYICKVILLIFLIDGFIGFALKLNESRLLLTLSWVFAFILMVSFRRFACWLGSQFKWWKTPTVVIGDNATVTDLIYAFHADPYAGYDVHTVFLRDRDRHHFDLTTLPHEYQHMQVRNGLLEYESYISSHPDEFYVVSLDAFRGETRDRLINALDEAEAAYAIVPSITRIGLYEMEPHYFFGHDIMMLQVRLPDAAAFSGGKIIKRCMDIVVASLALVAALPLFVGVAVMLKLEGQRGTIFYCGKRVGYQGRLFKCWKIRSMEPDSDHLLYAYLNAHPAAKASWDQYRKLPDDPRVKTRTAHFIRRFSIDELPQLWNVLIGDMSLVGPRPILEDEKSYFGNTLKEYLSVRPGLTGLWQVSGRNAASFMRRVYWDSWYVRNWSLWNDIVILIKTPLVLFNNKCTR